MGRSYPELIRNLSGNVSTGADFDNEPQARPGEAENTRTHARTHGYVYMIRGCLAPPPPIVFPPAPLAVCGSGGLIIMDYRGLS